MPRWSSASSTSIARWPWRSRRRARRAAPSGQRSRHAAASTSAARRSSVERDERHVALGGDAGRPQHEHRIGAEVGPRGQLDLAVDDDEPVADALLVADLVARRRGATRPSAIQPIVRAAAATSAISSSADAGAEAAATASWSSRRSTSPGRPVAAVQGDADVDERAVARSSSGEVVGRHEQVGVGRPPQRLHVAQPAVAVLEVGLEQVGDVAGLGAALDAPASAGRRASAGRCAASGARPSVDQPGGRAPRRRRACRALSSAVAVSRSSPASASWSSSERTAWPSLSPASHSGYHSAVAELVDARRPCRRGRAATSTSLCGASSLRP